MPIFDLTDRSSETTAARVQKTEPVLPVGPDTSGTQTPEDQKKEPEKMITLDGPLSQIYAKALMLAYGNEDMAAMIMASKSSQQATMEPGQDNSIYVYCVDGSAIDGEEVLDTTNKLRLALDSKKYQEVIVAAECNSKFSAKLGLLHESLEAMGVKVFHSTESIVNKLKTN